MAAQRRLPHRAASLTTETTQKARSKFTVIKIIRANLSLPEVSKPRQTQPEPLVVQEGLVLPAAENSSPQTVAKIPAPTTPAYALILTGVFPAIKTAQVHCPRLVTDELAFR